MEYGLTYFMVFKLVDTGWKYVTHFRTHHQARRYVDTHYGIFDIEMKKSID